MRLPLLVAALPFTSAIPQGPPTVDGFKVTILADSNRDGKVDLTGDSDLKGKENWTPEFGALFLANIVDTDGRCSSQIKGTCGDDLNEDFFGKPKLPKKPILDPELEKNMPLINVFRPQWVKGLNATDKAKYDEWDKAIDKWIIASREAWVPDKRIAVCHDSSDDMLRNETYLAPLRTRPIPELGESATGSITVADETAASRVRVFRKMSNKWIFTPSNYTFKAQDLKAGLELGIDARDVRRPGEWDGRATVAFEVQDEKKKARDSVALRVAPVLTQHHGQSAKQLLSASGAKSKTSVGQNRFIEDLREKSSSTGLKTPLQVLNTFDCKNSDIWARTFLSRAI
ncbi:hypothetical protein QQS21_011697 [Conoideocrella luteorostrata]|uniref:Protein-arginine deiminase C-terminal domain-containing protein n=1 Tax=Conoideocrella luteorostrata TaxID=1105319 RepID=A0AAJ0CFD9_9HYPO|nr:hypothetical protein QQS21_011697 [Conoideocrella luteorostrata]